MSRRRNTPTSGTRGFTLIEVVCVVILLAVLAGLIGPRLMSTGSRHAEREAAAVEVLLGTLAQRNAFSSEPVALAYEATSRRLALFVRRTTASTSPGGSGIPTATWVPDPLVEQVILEFNDLNSATIDGASLDKRGWRIDASHVAPRPTIALVIEEVLGSRARGRAWRIELSPGALDATRVAASSVASLPASEGGRSIDLDAVGRSREGW